MVYDRSIVPGGSSIGRQHVVMSLIMTAAISAVSAASVAGCGWLDSENEHLDDELCPGPDDPPASLATRYDATVTGTGNASDRSGKVYGGTEMPTAVTLTPGQILAIGLFERCSGTLIAPRWVLTAKHCQVTLADQFCIGQESSSPTTCFALERIVVHPGADVILAELTEDPRQYFPDIVPIPPLTDELDCSWMGTMAEAAGYGKTPTGDYGSRLFVAEPIVQLSLLHLTVDGKGLTGLCRGDSGGPVMVTGSDGLVHVAGSLSFGDVSCRGQDSFTRLDRLQGWILDLLGAGPIGNKSRRSGDASAPTRYDGPG